MKIAFFDTKNYDIESFDPYFKKNNVEVKYFESKLNPNTTNLCTGFDGVCVFVNDTLNEEVINRLYELGIKAIFLRCAGFNNVNLAYSFKKIHVFHVPSYSPHAIAEHAMAMYLTINRRIHKAYNRVREYNFSISGLAGNNLYGKTVGVIGTGKIGKIFINICQGFGMNVIAYDSYPSQNENFEYVGLEELFKRSDIISLHCPLTAETANMINKNSIALMKKGVAIINTSRGGLINSEDLLEAIKNRKIGSVCLDVYDEESDIFFEDKSGHIMNDDTLLQLIAMPNVIITSHQAFLTHEALDSIAQTTTNNIVKFFSGECSIDNELCYRCGNQANCQKKRKEKCF